MAGRTKTLAFYVLGTLVTLSVFFAVIELATRTVAWTKGHGFALALDELDATDAAITDIYQFHPFTGFILKPNRTLISGHRRQEGASRNVTDGHGFLSESGSLPLAKGSDEIRIATIGASTTANVNLSYAENWPGLLGAMVTEHFPDRRVTVINAAVPGFNTAQSIGNLALRVMPFKPDVVIIYHAYNDLKAIRVGDTLKPDFSNVHKQPYGHHDRPNVLIRVLNKSAFYVRTRNAYREFRKERGNNDVIVGDNRLAAVPSAAADIFEHNIRMLISIAAAGGARVILSSFATLHSLDPNTQERSLTPMMRTELYSILKFTPGLTLEGIFRGLSSYNDKLNGLATTLGTGWVDNAALVPHADAYFVDRVHFSRAGALRMAENFLPVTLEQLRLAEEPL